MASSRVDTSGKLSSATTHVSFVCQKCRQPLKLDHSFSTIGQPLLMELREPLTSNFEDGRASMDLSFPHSSSSFPETDEDPDVLKINVPPARSDLNDSSDFMLLGETRPDNMENLSHRLKVASVLFDIMSGQSEVDHPLCEECTDALLDRLDQQLKLTEDECRDYKEFLEKLTSYENKVDEAALDEELRQLHLEEKQLLQQLSAIEQEQRHVENLIRQEKEAQGRLDEDEEKYYKEYAEQKRQRLELEDENISAKNQLQYSLGQLNRLKQVNVFNATFHIWHSGHFGTINGFRLGRLPNIQVEWNEINAAWGQTALLLHSLARKVGLTFERYRLVPYGSHSYLELLTDRSKELPLYGSGGFRFLWDYKFDNAMVGFLDCLNQLGQKIGGNDFNMPYLIHSEKLEDQKTHNIFSIKIQFNSEEQWTKALKFALTNLKWCLSWIQAQSAK
ncbi:beclin-1-like isoform X2 [Pomacea canaliculata]|uniref:beclin-1-like isoform X2 n=1 Tax=Pomacea canaliculata TaxID=400727 RepID=UPI000D730621|nr:beclin-1-like isoform X2 [Pomacea canaliculata]